MKFLKDLTDIQGKKVLVWSDLDVPVESGSVVDATRLKNAAKTLDYLQSKEASILIIGHLGRPKEREVSFSLRPVAKSLGEILGSEVEFLEELKAPSSKLAMLENIRFWPAEENKDQSFARKIAKLGEIYVNDCFSTSHHAGATMLYLPKLLPSYAGGLVEKEVGELSKIIRNPLRPLAAIIGGAKLDTKLPVIFNLATVADKVLVGGKLMFETERRSFPENVVIAHDDVNTKDIGPLSIKLFNELISETKMVVWNGPMGMFEDDNYLNGTREVANSVIESGAYSVVGGGDTIAALNKLGLIGKISFVSTGGGAMLEFLAGKKLPGLEALGD